jgi:L-amino acid N-acyltransferase YncA
MRPAGFWHHRKYKMAVMTTRPATQQDAAAICSIYNEGIADRVATFETAFRTPADIAPWFDGTHPVVVVEDGGEVVAFAATFPYRARPCYAGVAEFSVYVKRAARGRGAGKLALEGLINAAEQAGLHKLVSRVFVENAASRALCAAVGFREVGVYENHAQLDGVWRDVVIVERLLQANL